MTVSPSEPACLVRSRRDKREVVREIVIEDSFAKVAAVLVTYPTEQWGELTISFAERRVPPFRFTAKDFEREVLARILLGRGTIM